MSTIPELVGYRVRKAREAKDFSQLDIANKLDLTPGAYAKIERGETDPSITRLYELAKILKCDILTFLEDKPRQIESPVTRAEFNAMHAQMDVLKKDFTRVIAHVKNWKEPEPVSQPVIIKRKRKAKKKTA